MTEILTVDATRAADVLAVIHEAFANRPPLDPPATALDETLESVGEALDAHGGLLVEHEGAPVGALLLEPRGRLLGLRLDRAADDVRTLTLTPVGLRWLGAGLRDRLSGVLP
jgi:tRNA threonylcarbamoyladenosine biosynthesis protein TsaE